MVRLMLHIISVNCFNIITHLFSSPAKKMSNLEDMYLILHYYFCGDNSFSARAGTPCRTVKSPPSRKIAMTFRAPAEPSVRGHSDGGNMRDLPDDGEMASIGRGKETGTPIKSEPSPAPEPENGLSKVARLSPKRAARLVSTARVQHMMILPSLLASRSRDLRAAERRRGCGWRASPAGKPA